MRQKITVAFLSVLMLVQVLIGPLTVFALGLEDGLDNTTLDIPLEEPLDDGYLEDVPLELPLLDDSLPDETLLDDGYLIEPDVVGNDIVPPVESLPLEELPDVLPLEDDFSLPLEDVSDLPLEDVHSLPLESDNTQDDLELELGPENILDPVGASSVLKPKEAYTWNDFKLSSISGGYQIDGFSNSGKQKLERNNGVLSFPGSHYNGSPVVSIKRAVYNSHKYGYEDSFAKCNITSLDLSGLTALETIGKYAFRENQLTSLDLSGLTALETIDQYAFRENELTSVDFSGLTALETIGENAFSWNQLTTLDLSGLTALETIGWAAFYENQLTTLDLSGLTALETIGDSAFYGNQLTTLDLSGLTALETIGWSAFRENQLTTLDLSGLTALKTIDQYAFQKNQLATVDFSDLINLTNLQDQAFRENKPDGSTIELVKIIPPEGNPNNLQNTVDTSNGGHVIVGPTYDLDIVKVDGVGIIPVLQNLAPSRPLGCVTVNISNKTDDASHLAGASFELVDTSNNNIIYILTDNGDGTYSVEDIPFGIYELFMTKAPMGFALNSGSLSTLTINNSSDCCHVLEILLKKITIPQSGTNSYVDSETVSLIEPPVQKTMLYSGNQSTELQTPYNANSFSGLTGEFFEIPEIYNTLGGAVFELFKYDEGTASYVSMGTATTNQATGIASFVDLEIGKYLIKEIVAPNGYDINPTEYELIIDENMGIPDNKIILEHINWPAPVVEKRLNDKANDDIQNVSRGDLLKYNLLIDLPSNISEYKHFAITDTADDGIVFLEDIENIASTKTKGKTSIILDGIDVSSLFTINRVSDTEFTVKANTEEQGELWKETMKSGKLDIEVYAKWAPSTIAPRITETVKPSDAYTNAYTLTYSNMFQLNGETKDITSNEVNANPTENLYNLDVVKVDGVGITPFLKNYTPNLPLSCFTIKALDAGDSNEKVTGAVFKLVDVLDGSITYTSTDNGDGTYLIEGIPFGTYDLFMTKPPYFYLSTNFSLHQITINNSIDGCYNFEIVLQKITIPFTGVRPSHVNTRASVPYNTDSFSIVKGSSFEIPESYNTLGGATFELFKYDEGTASYVSMGTSTTNQTTGIASFEDLELGKYLIKEITAPDGYDVNPTEYELIIDENMDIPDNKIILEHINWPAPVVEKRLNDKASEDIQNVSRGELLKYNLLIDLPSDISEYKHFAITDTADDGIVFLEGIENAASTKTKGRTSIMLDGIDVSDLFTISRISDTEFTVKANIEEQGELWKATMKSGKLDIEVYAKWAPSTIAPRITETVKPSDAYTNAYTLTYSNMFQLNGETKDIISNEVNANPFELVLNVLKTESDGQTPITGAEFILTPVSGTAAMDDYIESNTRKIIIGENGQATVSDLDGGEYELKETKAPDGYKLLEKPVKISVSETTGGLENNNVIGLQLLVNTVVKNYKNDEMLPNTGTTLTVNFAITGVALITIAKELKEKER